MTRKYISTCVHFNAKVHLRKIYFNNKREIIEKYLYCKHDFLFFLLQLSLLSGQSNWLQLDRKVLDHYFSKTSGPLELKFLVR